MSGVLHTIGDVIGGRYQVTGFIGQGGMQEVYKVRDKLLERDVALKSPKNPSAEKRFKRSAALSAKVNHDNVAKTLDYVEEGSKFYLIEELIDGCDLGEFLRNHVAMLDPFSAGRVLHHLAKGLAASHHVNVIHRDLKPTNVMVVGGRNFSGFKITDFGIAKMAAEEIGDAVAGDEEGLTSSQTALGALPYMAPETIDEMKNAGKPADVWAIGALTYELLTGKRPFGSGYKAVPLIQAAKVPPLPPIITGDAQFKPFAESIYNVITSCMKKDPADRLTADQLVAVCQDLYYSTLPRQFGVVSTFDYGAYGFINAQSGGEVFYHIKSVYASSAIVVGERVWITSYPGAPKKRAFPVVRAV